MTATEVVNIPLVLTKMKLPSKWRYLGFRLFSLFGHGDDYLILIPDIIVKLLERHAFSNHWLLDYLINSFPMQQPCKRPLWGESTLCYKGPFMRKARIVYRLVSQLNHCQCRKSSGWLSWKRYLSRMAHDANRSHPDDITKFRVSHLDDLARVCGLCGLDLRLCHSGRQSSRRVQDNSRLYAEILGHMLIHTAVFVWDTLSRLVKQLLKYSWDLWKHAAESYPPTKYHTFWPTTDTGRQNYDIWVFVHFQK